LFRYNQRLKLFSDTVRAKTDEKQLRFMFSDTFYTKFLFGKVNVKNELKGKFYCNFFYRRNAGSTLNKYYLKYGFLKIFHEIR
jgi:hypothetical protein